MLHYNDVIQYGETYLFDFPSKVYVYPNVGDSEEARHGVSLMSFEWDVNGWDASVGIDLEAETLSFHAVKRHYDPEDNEVFEEGFDACLDSSWTRMREFLDSLL